MQTVNLNPTNNTDQENKTVGSEVPQKKSLFGKIKIKLQKFKSKFAKMSFTKKMLLAVSGLSLTSVLAVVVIYGFVIFSTPTHTPLEVEYMLIEARKSNSYIYSVEIPEPPEVKDIAAITNGTLLSKSEFEELEEKKLLIVMIENHPDARPQSGLEQADIVYESLVESGITRFMAVYWTRGSKEVGPIRSIRTYFLDWASGYDNPSIMNIGQAGYGPDEEVIVPEADAQAYFNMYGIHSFDWYGRSLFWRDQTKISQGIAYEHTAYSATDTLWDDAESLDWAGKSDITALSFKKDAPLEEREITSETEIKFLKLGEETYKVRWVYDRNANQYKRYLAGEPHREKTTGTQLSAKNILIEEHQYSETGDKNGRILFTTIGSGKVTLLRDGKVIEGTWQKDTRTDRTLYYDSAGNELKLNRGKIWIEIVAKSGDKLLSEVNVQ